MTGLANQSSQKASTRPCQASVKLQTHAHRVCGFRCRCFSGPSKPPAPPKILSQPLAPPKIPLKAANPQKPKPLNALQVRDVVANGYGLEDGSADAVLLMNILHCEAGECLGARGQGLEGLGVGASGLV